MLRKLSLPLSVLETGTPIRRLNSANYSVILTEACTWFVAGTNSYMVNHSDNCHYLTLTKLLPRLVRQLYYNGTNAELTYVTTSMRFIRSSDVIVESNSV